MLVHIYCNRSGNDSRRYVLFGGLWVMQRSVRPLEKAIRDLAHIDGNEWPFSWDRITFDNWERYRDLTDLFFENRNVKFRAMVLDLLATGTKREELRQEEFCGTQYYRLFFETLRPDHRYRVFLNRHAHPFHRELEVLVHCVNAHYRKQGSMSDPIILSVWLLNEGQSVLWLLLNLLSEATIAGWEERMANAGQVLLIDYIAGKVGWEDLHEVSSHDDIFHRKFGIWKVNLHSSRRDQIERVRQLNLDLGSPA